jgi:hypothetical protein
MILAWVRVLLHTVRRSGRSGRPGQLHGGETDRLSLWEVRPFDVRGEREGRWVTVEQPECCHPPASEPHHHYHHQQYPLPPDWVLDNVLVSERWLKRSAVRQVHATKRRCRENVGQLPFLP